MKELIEKKLLQTFNNQLQIGKIEGNLFSDIQLKNIRYAFPNSSELFNIEEIDLQYSLFKLIKNPKNPIDCLKKVRVHNAQFHVHRNDLGLFNLQQLNYLLEQNNEKKQLPIFRGEFQFSKLSVFFTDEYGWNPKFKKTHLQTAFKNLNGSLTFQNPFYQLSLQGYIDHPDGPVTLSGLITSDFHPYKLDYKIANLPLDSWAEYILPIRGIQLKGSHFSSYGTLYNKPKTFTSAFPFFYRLSIFTESTWAKFNFSDIPFKNTAGHFQLSYGIAPELNQASDLASTKKQKQSHVFLSNPNHILTLSKIQTSHSNLPLSAEGILNISKKKLDLRIRSQQFQRISSLEEVPITGNITATITIKGPLKNPHFSGSLSAKKLRLYKQEASTLTAKFQGTLNRLSITKASGTLFKAPFKSHGWLSINKSSPTFKIALLFDALPVENVATEIPLDLSGTLNVQSEFFKTGKKWVITTTANSDSCILENQALNRLESQLHFYDTRFHHFESKSYFNSSPTPLTCIVTPTQNNQLFIKTIASSIPFKDPKQGSTTQNEGLLSGELQLNTPRPFHIDTLLNQSEGGVTVSLKNIHYYGQPYDAATLEASIKKKEIHIHTLSAHKEQETLSITGELSQFQASDLDIQLVDINLTDNPLIQKHVSDLLKPLEGRLSLSAKIKKAHPSSKQHVIRSTINLKQGKVANHHLDSLTMSASWHEDKLDIQALSLKKNNSQLLLSGTYTSTKNFVLSVQEKSKVDLNDFKYLTDALGPIAGKVSLSGTLKKNATDIHLETKFNVKHLSIKATSLEEAEGEMRYQKDSLFIKSLKLKENKERTHVSGYVHLPSILSRKRPADYHVKIKFKETQLETLLGYYDAIQKSFNRKKTSFLYTALIPKKASPFKTSTLKIGPVPSTPEHILYKFDDRNTLSSHFEAIKAQYDEQSNQQAPSRTQNELKASITGDLHLNSRQKNTPLSHLNLTLEKCSFPFFTAKQIRLQFLEKKKDLHYNIAISQGHVGQSPFQKIVSAGKLNANNVLHIDKTQLFLENEKNQDVLAGTIPLAPFITQKKHTSHSEDIQLTLTFEKNQISALSLLSNHIQSIQNDGTITLKITGPANKPLISAKTFELKNARIQLKNNAILHIPNSKIQIKNNIATIPSTKVDWTNKSLQDNNKNSTEIIGSLGLTHLDFTKLSEIKLNMNLSIKDTAFHFKNGPYQGALEFNKAGLSGEYRVALNRETKQEQAKKILAGVEEGPILSGQIKLKNGTLFIPKGNKTQPQLLLDLALYIEEDVFMTGSLFGSGHFAGISTDFELEKSIYPLKIKGTLNNPTIENPITFREGSMSFLNQHFELLSAQDQKKYKSQTQSEPHLNTLSFQVSQTDKKNSHLTPVLNVSALSIIEKISEESVVSQNTDKAKEFDHVILSFNGATSDLNPLTFNVFSSQFETIAPSDLTWTSKHTLSSEISQTNTSDIAGILIPELHSKNNASERFLTKFGENRVNLLVKRQFLRPLEKKIAKKIGLYDLKIDYNVGKEILKQDTASNQFLGLSFMHQILSDQLFLRVKTNLDLKAEVQGSHSNFEVSEIELQYFLLRNLSINYANVKDPFILSDYRPKFSLRYTHDY